jgi:hypothetical protein
MKNYHQKSTELIKDYLENYEIVNLTTEEILDKKWLVKETIISDSDKVLITIVAKKK